MEQEDAKMSDNETEDFNQILADLPQEKMPEFNDLPGDTGDRAFGETAFGEPVNGDRASRGRTSRDRTSRDQVFGNQAIGDRLENPEESYMTYKEHR